MTAVNLVRFDLVVNLLCSIIMLAINYGRTRDPTSPRRMSPDAAATLSRQKTHDLLFPKHNFMPLLFDKSQTVFVCANVNGENRAYSGVHS